MLTSLLITLGMVFISAMAFNGGVNHARGQYESEKVICKKKSFEEGYDHGQSDGDRHARQSIDMLMRMCGEDLRYKGVPVHSASELADAMNRLKVN